MTHQEPNAAKPVPAPAAAAPEGAPAQSWLTLLLERTKPYREIIGIAATSVTALSAAVAWAVAHFATEAELFYLECRINNNIVMQGLPLQSGLVSAEIDWRTSQIKEIAQLNTAPAANAVIAQLSSEISDLTKRQATLAASVQITIDTMTTKCNAEGPRKKTDK